MACFAARRRALVLVCAVAALAVGLLVGPGLARAGPCAPPLALSVNFPPRANPGTDVPLSYRLANEPVYVRGSITVLVDGFVVHTGSPGDAYLRMPIPATAAGTVTAVVRWQQESFSPPVTCDAELSSALSVVGADEACSSTIEPSMRMEAPTVVIWGRPTTIKISDLLSTNELRTLKVDGRSVPLREGDGLGLGPSWTASITAAPGAAVIAVELSWRQLEYLDGYRCRTAVTTDITAARGELPAVATRRGRTRDEINIVIANATRCPRIALVAMTLTVGTRRVTRPDVCRDGRGAATATWELRAGASRYAFRALGRAPAKQRVPFAIAVAGRVVRRGWFVIERHYTPPQRVWETSADRFWNLCIRDGRTISSSGGRLYCTLDETLTRTVRAVRR